MPEIALQKTQATITKVNPRKEKHGSDNVLACDVIISAMVPASVLSCLDIDGQSIEQHFWDNGKPRFPQVAALAFNRSFDHHVIKIGATTYKDVRVCKLKVDPLEGGVAFLHFAVQMRPLKQQVGILADLAEEQVDIEIEALQGDLLDEALKRENNDEPD